MRVLFLSLGLLMAGGQALADEAIRTAGAGSAPPSTDATTTAAQIERWIATSPVDDQEADESLPGGAKEPRKIHGEVGVGVGTGGYRSGYVITHIPIGETGSATIAFGQTDYGKRMVPAYGYPGYTSYPGYSRYPGYIATPFD